MKLPPRMMIANIGWSEFYRGDGVEGDHEFLRRQGWGAERFNFLPGPGRRFFGYVRPVSTFAPKPPMRDGWLIVFVSKRPGDTGLRIVGWYENASFKPDYGPRPEYQRATGFRHTPEGKPFPCLIEAKTGVLVPEADRAEKIDTTSMRRASIYYLRGGPTRSADRDRLARSVLGQLGRLSVRKARGTVVRDPAGKAITLDATRRREVEERSMEAAKEYFGRRDYDISDVSKQRGFGYDLFATKRKGSKRRGPSELLIEVKGTQGPDLRFLMTHGERRVMDDPINAEIWRLAMITNALSSPSVRVFDVGDARMTFDFSTFAWRATEKQN